MDELTRQFQLTSLSASPEQLIRSIENEHQRAILRKIFSGEETHKIYLITCDEGDDTFWVELYGGIRKGGKREKYKVVINKGLGKHDTGVLTCSCKDFIYRSSKLGIVCKHISFIVCKVMRLDNFFMELRLDEGDLEECLGVLRKAVCGELDTNSQFKKSKRELNKGDACPICYDEYGEGVVLSCPDCGNYVHEECVMVWLERNQTCVYCRSKSWSTFNKF